jgi:hypothetical protein
MDSLMSFAPQADATIGPVVQKQGFLGRIDVSVRLLICRKNSHVWPPKQSPCRWQRYEAPPRIARKSLSFDDRPGVHSGRHVDVRHLFMTKGARSEERSVSSKIGIDIPGREVAADISARHCCAYQEDCTNRRAITLYEIAVFRQPRGRIAHGQQLKSPEPELKIPSRKAAREQCGNRWNVRFSDLAAAQPRHVLAFTRRFNSVNGVGWCRNLRNV